jgi:hypothetical protein
LITPISYLLKKKKWKMSGDPIKAGKRGREGALREEEEHIHVARRREKPV